MYHAANIREPMLKHNTYGTKEDPSDTSRPSMGVKAARLERPQSPKCNDVFFAILFFLNVFFIMFFGFWKGLETLNSFSPAAHSEGSYGHVFIVLTSISAVSVFISLLWMQFLLAYAENMIRIALWLSVGFMVGTGIASLVIQPLMSFIMLFMAMITVCYIWAVQNRIPFASANLKCACEAILRYRSLFYIAILLVFIQLIWFILWVLGGLGVYQLFRESDSECAIKEKNGQICGSPGSTVALFFLLISLYWGQQVIENVLTCTTAGTVASWWYQEHPRKAVQGSLYRSLTTSFGSICFGSLLVSILQALCTMARYIREKAQEENNAFLAFAACFAECILNCLESIMEYINMWAYVYVGIYGYDFRTSGKAVWGLFSYRGWTAVINDDLTSRALGLGAFSVGIVTCLIALLLGIFIPEAWIAPLTDNTARLLVFGIVGFAAGFSMSMVLASVIIAALHTIFVCFAEDPISFSRTHPQLYNDLVSAWKEFHQDAWLVAYGDTL